MASKYSRMATVTLLLLQGVVARLGNPKNASASSPAGDLPELNSTLMLSQLSVNGGYEYIATTTRYGDQAAAACGGVNTAELVAGTDWYNVASAQAMWGGDHWCGKASEEDSGTAGMGCFRCAKGRFLKAHPSYGKGDTDGKLELSLAEQSSYESDEIRIVVGDLCPHAPNKAWCPTSPGEKNHYGYKNHFDFSVPPSGINNNYFVFTPIECSGEIREKFASAKATCSVPER
eukprot:TRINITY_DN755_c0_g1_i1.p1 TRINITY_DN755_c0_g1~~TRINITY_DN755_c0_g1_i1.p1  ORF type:complete len:255 (+),score=53.59 TRINITY_DN755_c0_g1_i1:70-765(+)